MKTNLIRPSTSESKCPQPSRAWSRPGGRCFGGGRSGLRHFGYGAAIAGVLALLMVNNGLPDLANAAMPSVQPEKGLQSLSGATTSTGEPDLGPLSALSSRQAIIGRCRSDDACHYSLALMEADDDAQSEGTSISFDPECAAKDLNANTRIEQLGISGEMSSDRLVSAARMLMTARTNCARGKAAEALRQYDDLLVHTLATADTK